MIQRKQTIYLLLALIATVVCLCLPVGRFEPQGMGASLQLYNLWIQGDGSTDLSAWPMFGLLVLSCPINLFAIFSFSNRILQSRLCVANILLIVAWHAVYAVLAVTCKDSAFTFHVNIAACLPFISAILYFMARKGIQHDEKLVRAADRIR